MTCTQERFLKDVANHEMHILRDDGVYRHVQFKRPGTGCMHFDLITYPGYLVYSGDMGCYVFSRLDDMFEFFRTDRQSDDGLYINKGYWAEKLRAIDGNRNGADAMEFDEDSFLRVINEYRIGWMRNGGINKDARRELWEEVENDVIASLQDGEHAATHAAYSFRFLTGNKVFKFDDLFEHNFKRYTFHFIWCCYALAWGIKKYDEAKAKDGASSKLWCIYIPGPCEAHAAPSKSAAEHMANKHNAAIEQYFKDHPGVLEFGPPVESTKAQVIEWPYDADEHAESLKEFDAAAWGLKGGAA